ncbi:hypothetical protein AA0115_g524 [Alternaria tenuissima]|uniref:Uncharacterized protein n=1 Tax=Alternaria tenuissima TaxID=119927 RepID=A0AB37WY98_9PLEO|nr:hypothetical protein AA0115_g524 [Alternaria tenuissima]
MYIVPPVSLIAALAAVAQLEEVERAVIQEKRP